MKFKENLTKDEYYNKALKYKDINKEKYILYLLQAKNLDYVEALSINYFDIINNENVYKIIFSNIDKDINGSFYNYLGFLYKNGLVKDKKEERMLYCYEKAIEKGNSKAMNNLGVYYYDIKDYNNMIKYFLMAIDNGDVYSMNNLGGYYYEIKDYENMEKYYLMAIKSQNTNPMILNRLIDYYNESNNTIKLIKLYELINNEEETIPLLVSLLSEKNELPEDILDIILNLKSEKLPIGLQMLRNTIRHNIDIIDLHFNYKPESNGHKDALNDYKKYVTSYN